MCILTCVVVLSGLLSWDDGPGEKGVLVSEVRKAVESLDTLSFAVDIREASENMSGPGGVPKPAERRVLLRITMAKGGRFRVEGLEKDLPFAAVVCDGENVVEWESRENLWTKYRCESPGGRSSPHHTLVSDPLIVRYAESWLDHDSGLGGVLDRLASEPEARLAGTKKIRGRECDVLTFEMTESRFPLSMTAKYELLYDRETHFPVREVSVLNGRVLLVQGGKNHAKHSYREVRFNPTLATDAFAFKPPEGSTFVPPDDPRFAKPTLDGKPAPEFSLSDLDGKPHSLAEAKGRKATLVVFWATYCMPCRKELPVLAKLHGGFADKGLAVIGISTDRSVLTIQAFLKTPLPPYLILHDPRCEVANAYLVDGIPHTVLIDKSGVIVKTWVGGGSDELEKDIREELAKLGVGSPTSRPSAGGG